MISARRSVSGMFMAIAAILLILTCRFHIVRAGQTAAPEAEIPVSGNTVIGNGQFPRETDGNEQTSPPQNGDAAPDGNIGLNNEPETMGNSQKPAAKGTDSSIEPRTREVIVPMEGYPGDVRIVIKVNGTITDFRLYNPYGQEEQNIKDSDIDFTLSGSHYCIVVGGPVMTGNWRLEFVCSESGDIAVLVNPVDYSENKPLSIEAILAGDVTLRAALIFFIMSVIVAFAFCTYLLMSEYRQRRGKWQ